MTRNTSYSETLWDLEEMTLYNNDELIIVNKPPTIPVVPDKTGDYSLQEMVEDYLKHPIKVVHRLDRPCSGVVIFAKSKHASIQMSKQFKHRKLIKKYLAVVPKSKKLPNQKELEDKIYFNRKKNKSYVRGWMEDGGKIARMSYELIDAIKHYALLEVDLETGRHHQIRAQLAHFGYPIRGDVKYGFKRGNKDRSIQLHAWKIYFSHPTTKKKTSVKVEPPQTGVWKHFDAYRHN